MQREEPNLERFGKQVEYEGLVTQKTNLANLPQPGEDEVLLAAGGQGFGAQDWSDFIALRGLPRDLDE